MTAARSFPHGPTQVYRHCEDARRRGGAVKQHDIGMARQARGQSLRVVRHPD